MGNFSTTAKNTMLDALSVLYASLHDADPGSDGTNGELSGGSPAYARKAVVMDAAASGSRALHADVTFDVPASSSVSYVGYWTAATGGVFHGSDPVTTETFGAQGEYKLNASGTSLSISDS